MQERGDTGNIPNSSRIPQLQIHLKRKDGLEFIMIRFIFLYIVRGIRQTTCIEELDHSLNHCPSTNIKNDLFLLLVHDDDMIRWEINIFFKKIKLCNYFIIYLKIHAKN